MLQSDFSRLKFKLNEADRWTKELAQAERYTIKTFNDFTGRYKVAKSRLEGKNAYKNLHDLLQIYI